jgi:hypothetical protein
MTRYRCVVVALVVVSVASLLVIDAGVVAAKSEPACSRASGYADFNRVPTSVASLVEQSDAVVAIRAGGKEQLVTQVGSGSSISFLMRSPARVDASVKGDIAASAVVDLHRIVIGYDLAAALAQSRCMVGQAPRLVPGTRYIIGLVRGYEGRWFASSGPYSVIPLRERDGRLVAIATCPVDTTDCEQFPYTLAGRGYRSILREARAAAD